MSLPRLIIPPYPSDGTPEDDARYQADWLRYRAKKEEERLEIRRRRTTALIWCSVGVVICIIIAILNWVWR